VLAATREIQREVLVLKRQQDVAKDVANSLIELVKDAGGVTRPHRHLRVTPSLGDAAVPAGGRTAGRIAA